MRCEPVGLDAAAIAQALDLALAALADVLPVSELAGLVQALRYAASMAHADRLGEFRGGPTESWSMLERTGGGDEQGGLAVHARIQNGYALCRQCHLAVSRVRVQAATQM